MDKEMLDALVGGTCLFMMLTIGYFAIAILA